jgi:hypothetical protein
LSRSQVRRGRAVRSLVPICGHKQHRSPKDGVFCYLSKPVDENDLLRAAIDVGYTRIRPVLMTAAAMVVGMIPIEYALSAGILDDRRKIVVETGLAGWGGRTRTFE